MVKNGAEILIDALVERELIPFSVIPAVRF